MSPSLTSTRSVRLSPEQHEALARVAREQDPPVAQVVRRVVNACIAEHDAQASKPRRRRSTRLRRAALALLSAVAVMAAVAAAPASAGYHSLRVARKCGLVHGFIGGPAKVYVAADSPHTARYVTCRSAVHVLKASFTRPHRPPRGWRCFRGPLTGPGPVAAGASCVLSRQFRDPHVGVEVVAPDYHATAPGDGL